MGPVEWDSHEHQRFLRDGEPWARVSVSMADPRYLFPELDTFVLNAGAGTGRWGGTCGHTNGPVFDASPPFSVSMPGCPTVELGRIEPLTWQGLCRSDDGLIMVSAVFEAQP